MKTILILLKIWAGMNILFLGWFLYAHIFGEELMLFQSKKELIAFVFFPLGILLGLMISIRYEITGGMINFLSAILSILLIPELVTNLYFLIIVIPGSLLLLFGILKQV